MPPQVNQRQQAWQFDTIQILIIGAGVLLVVAAASFL
jgi:hypothetical protein